MFMAASNLSDFNGEIEAKAPPGLGDPITQWCMVLVRPSEAENARDCMRRMGVGVYWPNYPRFVTTGDRRVGRRRSRMHLSAVVPGALFSPARFTPIFWQAIDLAPGVFNVARSHDGNVILLDDVDIVIIHKIEQGLNTPPPPMKYTHNFKSGEKVKFVDDELTRWGTGKVARLLKDGRISVEVPLMGRMTAVIVYPTQISRV
jgi:transcription antitermination factor NusG